MKKRTAGVVKSKRPNWQLKVLTQAIAVAGAGLQAGAALAACPGAVTTLETTTCTLTTDDSVTISAAPAGIRVAAADAIQITGAGAKTITNSGEIDGTPYGVQAMAGATGTIAITNNASGLIEGVDAAIRINTGSSLILNNSGSITSTSDTDDSAIFFTGDFVGSITNDGTISAQAGGNFNFAKAAGIEVDGDLNGTITNSDTISAVAGGSSTSGSALGIYVNGALNGSVTNTNTGTISATADVGSTGSESAYAAGIYIDRGVSSTGSITNNGTITATANVQSPGGSASATGIFVDFGSTGEGGAAPALAGTLTNTGTITATATTVDPSGQATALGIALGSSLGGVTAALTGTLNNSGTISAVADAGSFATAIGVGVGGDATGTFSNSGSISAEATSDNQDALAIGVGVAGDLLGASFTNEADGGISASASGETAIALGIGVNGGVDSEATLTNDGTITVDAAGVGGSGTNGFGSAVGIFVQDALDGIIENNGTIDAQATGVNTLGFDGAEAYGIWLSSSVGSGGELTNSGDINVVASASDLARAGGIFVSGSMSGSITNTNTGTIDVSASGSSFAEASGILISSALTGSVSNAGAITVEATASSEEFARAGGIVVFGPMTDGATLTNTSTGTITVDAAGSFVDIAGIYVSSMQSGSTLLNNGTIRTNQNADESNGVDGAVVIQNLAFGASVTNSGTIVANELTGVGNGWAMVVQNGFGSEGGGFNTIMNTGSGVIRGNIRLNNASFSNSGLLSIPASDDMSFVGGNYTQSATGILEIGAYSTEFYGHLQVTGTADFTATGAGHLAVNVSPLDQLFAGGILEDVVSAGSLMTLTSDDVFVTDNSAAWDFTAIVDGEAGTIDLEIAGHTVPVLAAQSVQAANVNLDELSSIVMGRMDTRRLLVDHASHDQNLWFRPYGTTGSQDEDNDIPGYDIDTYGMVIGYDVDVGDGWNLGGALAYSQADIKSKDSIFDDQIDTDYYQGAVYAYWMGAERTFIDLMAIYGQSSNNSERDLGNGSSADGDYDGWYTRVSSAIGIGFPVSENVTLSPIASVSYTYVEEDGYNESGGGGSNLNVDDNDAQSLIFGLDGQLAWEASPGFLLTTHIGFGYDALTDDTSVTSSFVGGGAPFTTEGNEPDEWLGRAGVGAEMTAGDAVEIHINYEYEYRDTFDNNLLAATLRWKI